MDEYKDLIDLALKLNDKEWFNHLTEQAKQHEEVKPIDDAQNQPTNKLNITLEEFKNDGIVLQTNEGLRNPISFEELEKLKFVKIRSKRNNALRIYKGEEVITETITEEQSFYYKAYWIGYFQGVYNCYDTTILNKDKIIEKQESEIQTYKEINNILHNVCKESNKQNTELLKLLNNKKKISLWDRIKVVFKK